MSSSKKTRILLDTSYLLPILGVDVQGAQEVIAKLQKLYEKKEIAIFYTKFSLFEALGKISKLKYDEKRVKEGLQAIINAEIIEEASLSIEGYLEAIKLKALGFRDFIDLLLFETAKANQLVLLTRDEVLMAFVEEKIKGKKWILLEQEFKNM